MTRFSPLKRGVSYLFPKSLYKGEVILMGTPKNQGKSSIPWPQAQKV